MKARIAILAALPRELRPLVRDWPVQTHSRKAGFMIAECEHAIAVCAGMGRERVTRALELAESRGSLSEILSVGYAGALREGLRKLQGYWPSVVIDARTGERYTCPEGSGTLVTMDRVVGANEKPLVAARWNADLVDMEAATVARLARMRGLRFRALRVVSDEAGDRLPEMNGFTDARGGFREAAFAACIALRPWLLPVAFRMGRNAAQGSRTLAQILRKVIGTD